MRFRVRSVTAKLDGGDRLARFGLGKVDFANLAQSAHINGSAWGDVSRSHMVRDLGRQLVVLAGRGSPNGNRNDVALGVFLAVPAKGCICSDSKRQPMAIGSVVESQQLPTMAVGVECRGMDAKGVVLLRSAVGLNELRPVNDNVHERSGAVLVSARQLYVDGLGRGDFYAVCDRNRGRAANGKVGRLCVELGAVLGSDAGKPHPDDGPDFLSRTSRPLVRC